MKNVRAVHVFILAVFIVPAALFAGPFTSIVDAYRISVRTDADSRDFLPTSWIGGEVDGKAERAKPAEIARFPALLARALGKYPAAFIARNLAAIHIAGRLEFFGQDYGGTNSSDVVYLCSKGAALGYTDLFIEATFHHEFFHILHANYAFPAKAWDAANPAGFAWGEGGMAAMRAGKDDVEGSPADYRDGFLAPYSRSGRNEDAALYAEWYFTRPAELAKLAAGYPRVRAKVAAFEAFMKAAAPGFTSPLPPRS